jgi:rubredoxin
MEGIKLKEVIMPSWRCSNCGYTLEADTPPEECPSCKGKCEFVDNTCYTPDCGFQGTDKRVRKGSAMNKK